MSISDSSGSTVEGRLGWKRETGQRVNTMAKGTRVAGTVETERGG